MTDIKIRTLETPSLGDRSYLVHDGEVAFVVDPQRDIDRVLDLAAKVSGRPHDRELDMLRQSVASAREGATHEQAKPENDKDTRAIEAGLSLREPGPERDREREENDSEELDEEESRPLVAQLRRGPGEGEDGHQVERDEGSRRNESAEHQLGSASSTSRICGHIGSMAASHAARSVRGT